MMPTQLALDVKASHAYIYKLCCFCSKFIQKRRINLTDAAAVITGRDRNQAAADFRHLRRSELTARYPDAKTNCSNVHEARIHTARWRR